MLWIKKKQMDALARQQRDSFALQFHGHYSAQFPARMSGVPLRDVDQLIAWAADLHITKRYDVQRLGEILLAEAQPLTQQPSRGWIAAHLAKAFPTGTACVDALREAELMRSVSSGAGNRYEP